MSGKARELALRALARRDHSAGEIDARLARARAQPGERAEVLAELARAGYLDDERFAAGRARVLAERGWGDEAIRRDLEARGVAPDVIAAALRGLASEQERAGRVAAALDGVRAARTLARKGFSQDVVEAFLGRAVADEA